jgi:quercetin dioxygenase-like cupin family protein
LKAFKTFCLAAVFSASPAERGSILIDNEQVRVIGVALRPHETAPLNAPDSDCVAIYLNAGKGELDLGSGRRSFFEAKPGDIKWIPGIRSQAVRVTTESPINVMEVELKKGAPGITSGSPSNTLDPVMVDPKHYTLAFENERVRVLRVRYGPRELAPMHQHSLNRVVVYLTDQETRVTEADGKATVSIRKAGEVSWGTRAKHTEQNLRPAPFEVIVVEPKN